ncbi:MAG: hypothetical protein P3X22_005835 [Thermoprotei archaeon]|nr:hypothetical protein [Thermoprotei archaeon]
MGLIEADIAVVHGRIVDNFRIPFGEDLHFKVVLIPGFSDGHAHPQVVDGGLRPGVLWRDSYDWIENRDLSVDEVMVRRDLGLASKLALLTFYRALLEGTTLISLTGRLAANVKAWVSMTPRPKAVMLPTVMDREGWTVGEVKRDYERVSMMVSEGLTRLGVFVHSIRLAGRETIAEAVGLASQRGGLLGLHMGEGRPETGDFKAVFGEPPYPSRIVPVHCIDDDVAAIGLQCVSCPLTNLLLYGRTRSSLAGVGSFGSDWPLLLGTVPRHLPIIAGHFKEPPDSILRIATIGGYRVYNMPPDGDIVGYDDSLQKILEGRTKPKFVTVKWETAVYEGTLTSNGLTLENIEKAIVEAVREATEKYGKGGMPYIPKLPSM